MLIIHNLHSEIAFVATLYDILATGGVWWPLDNPRSPGHAIALREGTRFKIRVGGTASNVFAAGLIAEGYWEISEGTYVGRYCSANEAVRAVHRGTSLNAWLYVLIEHDGEWVDAELVRTLPASELVGIEQNRIDWCLRNLRDRPEVKGASEQKILIAAAKMAARMDEIDP
jgi:hypothetical protein